MLGTVPDTLLIYLFFNQDPEEMPRVLREVEVKTTAQWVELSQPSPFKTRAAAHLD